MTANSTSELNFLAGNLGIIGEHVPQRIANVLEVYRKPYYGISAAELRQAFEAVFGGDRCAADTGAKHE